MSRQLRSASLPHTHPSHKVRPRRHTTVSVLMQIPPSLLTQIHYTFGVATEDERLRFKASTGLLPVRISNSASLLTNFWSIFGYRDRSACRRKRPRDILSPQEAAMLSFGILR